MVAKMMCSLLEDVFNHFKINLCFCGDDKLYNLEKSLQVMLNS